MHRVSKLRVARYVRDCLRREDVPRVSELAQREGVTAEHLSRAFRERFNLRISDFLKILQVRAAQRLLRDSQLTTTRIAYLCGFGTRRTFFRTYRRITGTSPVADGTTRRPPAAGPAGPDPSGRPSLRDTRAR
ncbi:MAG: AraC family transcriptional regulator [Acidobacteriota bacterium]|nr:AraC family transcriptional regulator [Acidobacteriota bacterium]